MTFLDPIKVTDGRPNNEEVDEMEEVSTTTQTYNPQAGSRVQHLLRNSPSLPTGQNTRTKLDMSVSQPASSAQVALTTAIPSPSHSESLAPGSEVDPPVPGPGDSGLAPIDADTYALTKICSPCRSPSQSQVTQPFLPSHPALSCTRAHIQGLKKLFSN